MRRLLLKTVSVVSYIAAVFGIGTTFRTCAAALRNISFASSSTTGYAQGAETVIDVGLVVFFFWAGGRLWRAADEPHFAGRRDWSLYLVVSIIVAVSALALIAVLGSNKYGEPLSHPTPSQNAFVVPQSIVGVPHLTILGPAGLL
jgi:hypothetical protein